MDKEERLAQTRRHAVEYLRTDFGILGMGENVHTFPGVISLPLCTFWL